MSKTHTVKKGDLLYKLSIKYYGSASKWKNIENANPQLKGRKTASDGSPLIYPGDNLIIPEDENIDVPGNINIETNDEVSIIIDGNKFIFFTDYIFTTNIDTFDTFSFSSPFEVLEQIYRDAFRPFSYKSCQVYYGGDLFFDGILLAPQSQSSANSKTISISGYPKCGVLNDVNLPITKFPIEFNNQDLQKIANNICEPFGIQTEFQKSAGNTFKKVTPEPDSKCLDFLVELSGQRGLLVTNNSQGNLLFWEAKTGSPIATINEGETPFLSCEPTFNPQEFYSHITGISKTTSTDNSEKYTYENTYLINKGVLRPYNYIISDAEKSDIKMSVTAKAGRMFASSCGYKLTVQGHRDKNNNIWTKNTLISVYAPGSMIYRDTVFLIKSVSINKSSTNGDTAVLNLVLPGSYSNALLEVFAWEE